MEIASPDKASLILLKKFSEAKQKNTRWSQRSFAQRLGISSGALSEIIKGKRILSSHLKKRIAPHLDLSAAEEMEFFEEQLPDRLKRTKRDYHKIEDQKFRVISDWWHFAILNLMNTKNFKNSIPWMSQRLGLDQKIVEESWHRLIELGYVVMRDGRYQRAYPQIETSDHQLSLSVRKAHCQDLELIKKALNETPISLRDTTSMTLPISLRSLARAKELIRQFEDQFAEEIIGLNDNEEVYKLSVSFFPLTQVKDVEV